MVGDFDTFMKDTKIILMNERQQSMVQSRICPEKATGEVKIVLTDTAPERLHAQSL